MPYTRHRYPITSFEAPDTEEPMEVDAVEASVDAPAATATPEVVRPTKDVQEPLAGFSLFKVSCENPAATTMPGLCKFGAAISLLLGFLDIQLGQCGRLEFDESSLPCQALSVSTVYSFDLHQQV